MSKTCGDTARFNRLRKGKLALRMKRRAMLAAIEAKKAAATKPAPAA